MKTKTTQSDELKSVGEEIPALQPLAEFLTGLNLSHTTGWRWRKRGWLQTITIANRPYMSREAVLEFRRRAEAGEFATVSTI